MAKRSKKYRESLTKIEKDKLYSLEEAIKTVKEFPKAKFDESVDVSVNLNLGKNQRIRGVAVLPNSFGKPKRVVVIAKGEKAEDAKKAGADFVGDIDIIEKIKKGWFDFDVVIATPDMMKDVSKLGPILGKKGLMPNPKTGTVTMNIKEAVQEAKKGRVEFKSDRAGVVNLSIGKVSMEDKKLVENFKEFYSNLLKTKPQDAKGEYVKKVYLTTTMGPGVKINHREIA